jgi:hypothetical protein
VKFERKSPVLVRVPAGLDADVLERVRFVAHSTELTKLVDHILDENQSGFLTNYSQKAKEENPNSSLPTKDEIRLLVKRHILPEYDQPQIIEAVSEYLYDHFMMF